ncbi:hypothetical protein [Thermocatellispora tengchongensis]|uniref:hypothetical protein n=1 Tax=Thermocatellispora tengchongensis TaxID=1073253 RepID=UPI00363C013C
MGRAVWDTPADLADWLPMDVDIWAWVGDTQRQLHGAGNAGLAIALGDIPAQAYEGRYSQLDVVAPAVANQAESMELPWLEFYARYWHLIGRIGDRAQGAVALKDAAELVAFAEREDVRDCPSVPAAYEALAVAQANADGPGYAEERLAMLGARLADVEPGSPAFAGLTTQYVAGLLDSGKADEAVAYAESAIDRLRAAELEASWELAAVSARALLAAGRAEDALAALDAATGFKPDDPIAKPHREGVLRARVLGTLGRTAEAVEALPDLDVVGDHPRSFVEWAETVRLLAGSEQIANTWQLGRVLRQWIDYFAMMGGYRARVELALIAGEMALARQGVWQARALADIAETGLAELKTTEGLPERIAELRAAADATTPLPPPGEEAELVGLFDAADGFNADPERWVGWLAPCRARTWRPPAATPRRWASSAIRRAAPTSIGPCWSRATAWATPPTTTWPTSRACSSRRARTSGWSSSPPGCRRRSGTSRWPGCTGRASAGPRPWPRPRRPWRPARASTRAGSTPAPRSSSTRTPRAPRCSPTCSTPASWRTRTSGA